MKLYTSAVHRRPVTAAENLAMWQKVSRNNPHDLVAAGKVVFWLDEASRESDNHRPADNS